MAAKRHSESARRNVDAGFAVHPGKDEIEGLTPGKPVRLPAVADGGGVTDAWQAPPKAAPGWRGTDRGGSGRRAQGAPQARRYAFRRS
ncbi:hypothetical protein [Micromonospora sp. NPDC049679]|uniref:hypothetical protein n=1 Tax=Micromonospora sp. NPDC049679 TaxID=3155920 RepID=UPI0033EB0DFE